MCTAKDNKQEDKSKGAASFFEVAANIGDSAKATEKDEGTRTYLLEAKDAAEAKEWMEVTTTWCGVVV